MEDLIEPIALLVAHLVEIFCEPISRALRPLFFDRKPNEPANNKPAERERGGPVTVPASPAPLPALHAPGGPR